MSMNDNTGSGLVPVLLRLHRECDQNGEARARLANLRHGLRDRLHADYPVGRVFPALSGVDLSNHDDTIEWYTVIAALFGFAHKEVEYEAGTSLGSASRELYIKRQSDSLERRFMALLNSDAEYLPGHLRQTLSLMKAESIKIDWERLLRDTLRWNEEGKPVQKQWARDYYRSRPTDNTTAETATDNTPTGE
jgi:CRISPR system Cascade subunit CasB